MRPHPAFQHLARKPPLRISGSRWLIDLSWRSPVATHVLWEATSRAPIVAAAWMEPGIAREIEVIARKSKPSF
jgi:hypothetical protein